MAIDRRHVLTLPLAHAVLCAAPARAATTIGPGLRWPAGEWERATPEEAGWADAPLRRALAEAQSAGTASLLVVQRGRIVASWGDTARRLELHSVRKSLLSALIGIAVAQGRIDLDATLAALDIDDVPPALTDAEKQATVRQLLQARSGVYHPALYETLGEKRNRPSRGSHPPGSFWYYNNWDFNVLGSVYERAVGGSVFERFDALIARPLGMQDYRPQDGRYVRGADSIHPAYPFRMSARDLARFGLMYLRAGRWAQRAVVPPEWVAESTRAWSETRIGSGYGYLWWTGFPDRRVPVMNLSPGGFWADGHNGQYVVVDPANDLVVVHQTDRGKVDQRRMGGLMGLILSAAPSAGDPVHDAGEGR